MPRDAQPPGDRWTASLALAFERRGARTVLASRRHDGPLAVQKPLYPEGDAVCHTIVVHPPGGIAGGDELAIDLRAAKGAHALLTTPGAGRWYRSVGPWARQRVLIEVAEDAIAEWLPQETIVFDGARADLRWEARIAPGARLVAWDILCLGRTGSRERFTRGEVRSSFRVTRGERPLWIERAVLEPGSPALGSPAGLAGRSVSGTLVAVAASVSDVALAACRAIAPVEGEAAVTRIADVVVARYRGDASEAARRYFTQVWSVLRPHLFGREAIEPRIWRT